MEVELKKLKDLALPILVPSELPDDFSLERVLPIPDHRVNDGYEIEITSPEGQITLMAVSSQPELGMHYHKRIEFETKYFGTCVVECSGKNVVSEWFSEMRSGYPAYKVQASGVSADQVIEFVRSLDYMRIN